MKNKKNRGKYFYKLNIIKNLPYLLLLLGLLLGFTDYLLDKYVNLEWIIWPGNTLFLMFLGYKIGKFIKNMHLLVYRDSLTELPNRGYFYFRMNNEIYKMGNKKNYLSLAMIDIDHYKLINDTYGHLEGDKVIKNIAYLLKQNIRENDAAIRWGGDEFTLILPNTNKEDAYKIADRIRSVIEMQEYSINNILYKVTVSIGVYTIKEKFNIDEVLCIADKALYKAKIIKNNVAVMN